MENIAQLAFGAAGLASALYVALLAAGIVGAICSIVGLVRGVTNRNTTAIAVGGVGVACAFIGVFVLMIVFWVACFICGVIACRVSNQPRMLSYEEFKQQKAMMQDPDYAEYVRSMQAVNGTQGATLEQRFDSKVAANPILGLSEAQFARLSLKAKHGALSPAEQQMYNDYVQASAKKHGGKVKPPMSDGKLGVIVLAIIIVGIFVYFAFTSAAENGVFDHLTDNPAVEQQQTWSDGGGKQTIEDLGDGTILFLNGGDA